MQCGAKVRQYDGASAVGRAQQQGPEVDGGRAGAHRKAPHHVVGTVIGLQSPIPTPWAARIAIESE
jgi:hypothetical protein